MRFSELHLIRYGQFDRCRLLFPKTPSDLHIVYGPNEAGKSTTMAAITDLLFGFPHAAGYDFQFDKLLLRVGGVIEGSDTALTCRRKRGNVRTLLDGTEQSIDERPLMALLAGQTRDSFLRAFSLDHTRLRDGGRSILEAKDDIGQAIFAAGSGLVGIARLTDTLEEEAKAIWSERASVSRHYYVAQKAHDEARVRLRNAQLKSAHWGELEKALDGHERDLQKLRSQRGTLQVGLQRAERGRRILAPIARHTYLLNQLASLGTVPSLPADARAVLDLASRQISESDTKMRFACEQGDAARKQLSEMTYDPELLGRRAQVTQLRAQQGAVDKAVRDTPGLKTKVAAAVSQLSRLLREVGWPDAAAQDVQAWLPGRPQLSELRALLEEQRGIEGNRDAARNECDEQSRLASELQLQLDSLPSAATTPLFSSVLHNIRSQGDLEPASSSAHDRHEKARRSLEAALTGLMPWRGTGEELAALALPSEAETYTHAEALVAAEEALEDAEQSLMELNDEQDHRELRRSQLLRDDNAVSFDMLQTARETRDATWSRFSEHISGAVNLQSLAIALAQFPEELHAADALADRRFDGAKTSAALLGLDQDLERVSLAIGQAARRQTAAKEDLIVAQAAWLGITEAVGGTLSPDGWKTWRASRQRALDLTEIERQDAGDAAKLAQAIETARGQLVNVLLPTATEGIATWPLGTLLQAATDIETQAREVRDQTIELRGRIKAAEETRQRAEIRADTLNQHQENWRGRWLAALAQVRLDPTSSLSLIRARLDLMDELRSFSDAILGYEQRIFDIGNDVTAFTALIQALAGDFHLAPTSAEPFAVLTFIEQHLATIATLAERAAGLRKQLAEAEWREQEAKETAEMARAALSPLLAAAKVEDLADLARLIDQAEASKQLKTEVETLTRSILELGDGLGFDCLLSEANGADAAELAAQSGGFQDQLSMLSTEIERLTELRQTAHLKFKEADDRSDAAIAAADLAQARAEMEAQAEAYVRKRTEASLLRWTVERYQREKQAPLLKRASEIFSDLTLGRYITLEVDLADGRPRLSGVRADGATVVPVNGMSEGTIDQLFLSLRLAAVEESVASGVKLPFLADDLFINYDDARSAAGFKALAKLAEHTQVLFFTHHEHLANLASEALNPSSVSTCRLGEIRMEAA